MTWYFLEGERYIHPIDICEAWIRKVYLRDLIDL
jgi:hypothetical protein